MFRWKFLHSLTFPRAASMKIFHRMQGFKRYLHKKILKTFLTVSLGMQESWRNPFHDFLRDSQRRKRKSRKIPWKMSELHPFDVFRIFSIPRLINLPWTIFPADRVHALLAESNSISTESITSGDSVACQRQLLLIKTSPQHALPLTT